MSKLEFSPAVTKYLRRFNFQPNSWGSAMDLGHVRVTETAGEIRIVLCEGTPGWSEAKFAIICSPGCPDAMVIANIKAVRAMDVANSR